MGNMFSGNKEKKIPKDFESCYKTDSITENLWVWAERLEKWGKILFWILIVIGVVDTILAGINAHQLIEEIGAETVEEIREASAEMGIEIPTIFEALVNNLLIWMLYSFLEYCAYHILALLISSLASIVQHTKITANVTLYNSAKAEHIADNSEKVSDNKTSPSLPKNDYSKKLSDITVNNSANTWKCTKCGSSNPQGSLSCKTCGNYK